MAATGQAPTATEYIVHHLTHLSSAKQKVIIDFSIVNFDTVFFSVLMLGVTLWILRSAAKRATSGVPGKFQAFVEMLVELVEEQSKSIVHGDRTFIAPLALTVFVWILLMNAIDLVPVDLLPWIAGLFGIHYLRPLPTADLNGTLGMSFGVFLLMIYYGIKIKGFGGFLHELVHRAVRHVEEPAVRDPARGGQPRHQHHRVPRQDGVARHAAVRQHVRRRAAVLPDRAAGRLRGDERHGRLQAIGHVVAGTAWLLFHILIILLQAFIFMMLTLVYIGQAHEGH